MSQGLLERQNASELISIVTTRTREAVARWRDTGDLSGVPPEIAAQIPASVRMMAQVSSTLGNIGSGIMQGVSSLASGIASGIGSIASGIGSAVSSIASGIGSLFAKGQAREERNYTDRQKTSNVH